jgi:hypothetical protein
MKLSKYEQLIISVICLATSLTNLSAEPKVVDPYALPKDKSVEDTCRKLAIAAHPGKVFSFNVYNDNNDFHYQYEINDQDKNWLVICDGGTKRIIKDESEDLSSLL